MASLGALGADAEVPAVNITVKSVSLTGDEGDADTIAEIKRELVVLEERLSSGYEMPSAHQRGALTGEMSADQIQMRADVEDRALAAVFEVFVAARLAQRERETAMAIRVAFDDPQYRGFSDNRFVVDRWHGVHVDDGAALAVLEAHQEYLVNGQGVDGAQWWSVDPKRRWQVHLAHRDGRWRLVEQAQLALAGQG